MLFLCLFACVLDLVARAESSEKPVTIVLNSKWTSTPLLQEASEFFAEESDESFWKFVESISQRVVPNEKDGFDLIKTTAKNLLSPLKSDLLSFSLSLREYSPKIEMFYQLSRDLSRNECEAFVTIEDQISCSPSEIKSLVEKAKGIRPAFYSFDHHYPTSQTNPVTVVLYARLGTQAFIDFHTSLTSLVAEKKIHYILRHFTKTSSQMKTRLSGYGVELAIKSTEYKAIDDTEVKDDGSSAKVTSVEGDDEIEGFLFNRLKSLHEGHNADLSKFRKHLVDSRKEMAPLKAWQLQDIGFQAAQRVLSAPPTESLRVLRDLSQSIPQLARSLTKIAVKPEMRKEVVANQRSLSSLGVDSGQNVFLLNGLVLPLEDTDPFTLLKTLRDDAQLTEGLRHLGVDWGMTKRFLSLDLRRNDESFGVDLSGSASLRHVNDLEKDARYRAWPKSVTEILRPAFPGTLRRVARNMFNAIFCVDPSTPDGVALLNMIQLFIEHSIPLRVGILVVSSDDRASIALAKIFAYMSSENNAEEALDWLISSIYDGLIDDKSPVTYEHVSKAFEGEFGVDIARDVIDSDQYDDFISNGRAAFSSSGLVALPRVLLNGVVLKATGRNEMEQEIVMEIHEQTAKLQQAVYYGIVTDQTNLLNYWMTRPNVVRRFNNWILTREWKSISLDETSSFSATVKYFSKKGFEFSLKPLSVWIAVDLGTVIGRQALMDALEYVEVSERFRLGVIPLIQSEESLLVGKIVLAALATQTEALALDFVKGILAENEEAKAARSSDKFNFKDTNIKIEKFRRGFDDAQTLIDTYQIYAQNVLELKPDQIAVIVNGKMIGPMSKEEIFVADDYSLLEKTVMDHYGTAIMALVNEMTFSGDNPDDDTSDYWNNLFLRLSSLLLSKPAKRRVPEVGLFEDHSCAHVTTSEDAETSSFEMSAIINPLSKGAQRMSALLMVLQNVTRINLKMYMNPVGKLSEMPVKRFYRYVLEPSPQFASDGSLNSGPAAVFADLPEEPLFTLNMDVPKAWMAESVSCVYDLDNIHLKDVDKGIYAEFELANILVEGQCVDPSNGQPIRGLQFVLGTTSEPEKFDTIVMANLGYFQLKASAGVWNLKLREGRSADIYDVTSHTGTDLNIDDKISIALGSFSGKFLQIRATKKPGKEKEDILEGGKDIDELEEESFWDSLSNFVGGGKTEEQIAGNISSDGVINVFSVASGHLYERFLRIMMLSVLKHASIPVKFWFLKNFLSPTIKAFLPFMAEQYGFEYELVEYKWPHWLHGQTEKQRLIWGYKILFLDVLFPLSVKKIIFVDADQIVRADLKELVDMNLDNAPYAYTPFCDDRTEMDGFRFWKSGYWKSHLGGRKYHISALYVVDLNRFRQLAAGDRLRSQYQGLSQDPNSLANLDQDLPNNMIHQVAIKSLPQEWLWCETWCSDESKLKAKTIDLCNNPLTKEPKLKAAVRIVSEWTDYDDEIRQLQERFAAKNESDNEKGESDANVHRHTDL
ncbi:UDP-glucose:glycoprotein glucosyltransferase 1-like isoform X2 [Oscarella lobularis]|uniref:UDP-glucose:glycoprotein glucosyltransferase 1-like isoform X2 n=1 Tax=Oscarella lobularis TaxID=121494 RepID=UPI0033136CF5